jgi:hypothetical protein
VIAGVAEDQDGGGLPRRPAPTPVSAPTLVSAPTPVLAAPPPVRAAEPVRPPVRPQPQPQEAQREAPRPRPAPQPMRAPAGPPAERNAGWLSDLLARASREDEQDRGPAAAEQPQVGSSRSMEVLDTMASSIGLLIYDAALADMWDRFRRGERNAFSTGLYTPQGQQTFEDIRRRYRADADFRETVNRYMREFERLLTDMGRDDRDGSRLRGYLGSATGKVYTLLAHAAGRLG